MDNLFVFVSLLSTTPTTRLAQVDLEAALVADDDLEAGFFLRGMEDSFRNEEATRAHLADALSA